MPLAAGCYCDRNADPIKGPCANIRGRWPEEPVATRRLGGFAGVLLHRRSIVRLLSNADLRDQLEGSRAGYVREYRLPADGEAELRQADAAEELIEIIH